MNWRRADAELNYRRFFAVTTLAGVRVEDSRGVRRAPTPRSCAGSTQGWSTGCGSTTRTGWPTRAATWTALAALTGGRYVLVEKILEPGEALPATGRSTAPPATTRSPSWTGCSSTRPARRALDALDTELRGGRGSTGRPMTTARKRAVADRDPARRGAPAGPAGARTSTGADDALAELLACFPVYRTLPAGRRRASGRRRAEAATPAPARPRPRDLRRLADRLRDSGAESRVRFQQTSGMVMAKGVEDTAFYRWTRFTSLTEVGGDPAEFALSRRRVPRGQQAPARPTGPAAMTTLSTHDTKRGEDVRARLAVLAEMPGRVGRGGRAAGSGSAPLPDGPLAHLLWQAAVGAWPIDRERLHALRREGGPGGRRRRPAGPTRTPAFEAATARAGRRRLRRPGAARRGGRLRRPDRGRPAGRTRLSAKLIQLTVPGVPGRLPGHRAVGRLAGRPGQPAAGRLRRAGELLARLDDGWLPPVDDDRRGEAAGHQPGAAAAPGPAGAVHRLPAAGRRRAGRRARWSPSTAAGRSPWPPGCRSGLAAAGGWRDTDRRRCRPGGWTRRAHRPAGRPGRGRRAARRLPGRPAGRQLTRRRAAAVDRRRTSMTEFEVWAPRAAAVRAARRRRATVADGARPATAGGGRRRPTAVGGDSTTASCSTTTDDAAARPAVAAAARRRARAEPHLRPGALTTGPTRPGPAGSWPAA